MKRKGVSSNPQQRASRGNVKSDFTPAQRQAIGEVALNYNEMEGYVDALFFLVANLPDTIKLEVSSRINGLEGKVEIIKIGARHYGLDPEDLKQLQVALGDGIGFMGLKGYRDAVVHARALNAPAGVGYKIERRAAVTEILLTTTALDALYEHITAVRHELQAAHLLLGAIRIAKDCAADDPKKARLEAKAQEYLVRFRDLQDRKRSLPQLPEFPSEQALQAARDAWFEARNVEQRMTWYAVLGF